MGVAYSTMSSYTYPYASKEGYESLEQQWMSLLVSYLLIFPAEKVPEI